MLATFKGSSIFDIPSGQNRLFSLVRVPPLGINVFADGGQGPEKPVMEEAEVEEEIFTFPYPEERGEISDIVNPPVEGIAGNVSHTKIKLGGSFVSRGDFSNIFLYLFFDSSVERPARIAEPEFVSLTRQSEVAGPYLGLLIYSGYAASNTPFNYTSGGVYERPSLFNQEMSYKSDKPLYEIKVPMSMISEKLDYQAKVEARVYVRDITQQKLQTYQNVTQEETNTQPIPTPVFDVPYNNVPDSRLDLKLDYETLQLELPSVRSELPVLDINIETTVFHSSMMSGLSGICCAQKPHIRGILSVKNHLLLFKQTKHATHLRWVVFDSNENEIRILPLQEHAYDVKELTVLATISQTRFDTVNIPKYDAKAKVRYETAKDVVTLPAGVGFDDTLLRDKFITKLNTQVIESGKHDIKLPQVEAVENRVQIEAYADAKDENRIKEYNVRRNAAKLFDNASVKVGLIEEPTFQYTKKKITPYDSTEDKKELSFSGIPEIRPEQRSCEQTLDDSPEWSDFCDNTKPLNFSLEFLDSQPIQYDKVKVSSDPYALFNLECNKTQTAYHDIIRVRDILSPHTEYKAREVRADLGSLNSVPDSRLDFKLDYETLQLELPSVRSELPVLDINIESNENEIRILPLQEHAYDVKGLTVLATISQTRFDTVNIPKYDAKAKVRYETAKDVVTLDENRIKEYNVRRNAAKLFDNASVKVGLIEEPTFQYNTKPLNFSLEFLDSQPIQYDKVKVSSDPYALFNLECNKTQTAYHDIIRVRDILSPHTEYKAREVRADLGSLVTVNYNSGRVNFLSIANALPNEYTLSWISPSSGSQSNPIIDSSLDSDYRGVSPEHNLENVVEQERELTGEEPNVRSEVSEGNIAQEEVYEKSEISEETETDESNDSSVGYVVGAAGAVGVGLLVALMAPFSLILNKESYESEAKPDDISSSRAEQESASETYISGRTGETNTDPKGLEVGSDYNMSASATLTPSRSPEDHNAGADDNLESKLKEKNGMINPSEPEDKVYGPKQKKSSENCKDTSNCFVETIDWLDGNVKDLTLTEEQLESISQCYAEEISNIKKARDYIKQRERKNPCGGVLYDRFHHLGFTEEQKEKYKLKDYIRDGEVQEGFKLATTVIAKEELEGNYNIKAVWVDDEKGGQLEKVTLKKSSAYAQLDMGIRKQGYTPIWKIMSYIDTETGEKRSGLYLETIAELHLEAKGLLGDKDEYGMKLMGIILLVNDQEPGRGAVSMHDYPVKLSDKIDILFKNDSAVYHDDRQSILNKQMSIENDNYPEIEKSPEKRLEPVLV